MRTLGCGLLAGAGIWSGVLAARRVTEEAARCGEWCRMLELLSFELERFRTPLPQLFASLSERLEGVPRLFCEDVACRLMDAGEDSRSLWREAADRLPSEEREILRPLGEVLGRFGAAEQTAAIAAARVQMNGLWQGRLSTLNDRRRVCLGVFSAGGILLSILLI